MYIQSNGFTETTINFMNAILNENEISAINELFSLLVEIDKDDELDNILSVYIDNLELSSNDIYREEFLSIIKNYMYKLFISFGIVFNKEWKSVNFYKNILYTFRYIVIYNEIDTPYILNILYDDEYTDYLKLASIVEYLTDTTLIDVLNNIDKLEKDFWRPFKIKLEYISDTFTGNTLDKSLTLQLVSINNDISDGFSYYEFNKTLLSVITDLNVSKSELIPYEIANYFKKTDEYKTTDNVIYFIDTVIKDDLIVLDFNIIDNF